MTTDGRSAPRRFAAIPSLANPTHTLYRRPMQTSQYPPQSTPCRHRTLTKNEHHTPPLTLHVQPHQICPFGQYSCGLRLGQHYCGFLSSRPQLAVFEDIVSLCKVVSASFTVPAPSPSRFASVFNFFAMSSSSARRTFFPGICALPHSMTVQRYEPHLSELSAGFGISCSGCPPRCVPERLCCFQPIPLFPAHPALPCFLLPCSARWLPFGLPACDHDRPACECVDDIVLQPSRFLLL